MDQYLNMSKSDLGFEWGIGMAAEADKDWTCRGNVVPNSDFRYILFGGWRSVFPFDEHLYLDIEGGGDQGYPILDIDAPALSVKQDGCPPDLATCVYPPYHLMERTYEPYNLQGGSNPHACKDMKDDVTLSCCDGSTACENMAGVTCKMANPTGYSGLISTVVKAALQQQQDKNVSLVPCVGGSLSNADCALKDDTMLSAALAQLPPLSPVCFYMGGM